MNFASEILSAPSYIPTFNRMGYMSSSLDEIQKAFVTHCRNNKDGFFLDIGCGFGVATLPVINMGRRIIACDLEEKHLNVLKENTQKKRLSLLTLIKGHFPNEVAFPSNTFDGINLSMVLHFFPPHLIEKVFKGIFLCLKEGGRLFITTSSPYQRALSSFIPLYERKRSIEEWPGYIDDIAKYVPHRAHLLPKGNIVFCINELSRLASKFGFHIQDARFFTREDIPADLRLEGREYSGIICEKPRESSVNLLENHKEISPIVPANIR